ncbi:MAG TPA: molybdopterin cofactor-binding domain-containing protein [Hyphomicrobiaceae bacterium]|nr:molybdopterin cofactor-binding domain-containing protein [Hyphomicrobiaceae bacterium]
MSTIASSPSLTDNPRCCDWLDLSRPGRVVLKSGKVEIGQGITTALVQIAADELDVAPGIVTLISGHTALGPLEAGTSSSLSIETGGRAVRLAASAVRAILLAEAAKLLQAPIESLSVDAGRIAVEGRETDLTYWSLAPAVDLTAPVMDHARPKAPAERRLVGTSMPRIDLATKAAGPGFIHDVELPGLLHGRTLDPPAAGRRLEAFDEEAFKRAFPTVQIVRDGSFVGVIAEREDLAVRAIAQAARLATWSQGFAVPALMREAIAADPAEPETVIEKGDVSAAEGRLISTEIERPYIAHASVAPSCAIATWNGDALEIYSHSQAVHDMRAPLAKALGIEAGNVVVIHVPGAGTYGHSGQDDVAYEAALLARAVPGRPVRLLWSRAADFSLAPLGPGAVVRAEAKVNSGGRITAFSIQSQSQAHVSRPGRGGTLNLVAAERLATPLQKGKPLDVPVERGGGADRNAVPLYAFPSIHVSKRILLGLPYRTSALRALGGYANIFAIETLMDDVAAEIGADPVAFRLSHLEDVRAAAVISKAAEMAGWPGPRAQGEGLGIGFCQYKNRSAYCAVIVRVVCDERVRVTHAWSAVDAGEAINPDGIKNQIEGSIVQSASWTLKEQVAFDGDAVATRDWEAYPILHFSEVPEIEVGLIVRPELPGLGVGETAMGPTAAAIGNAVNRALGIRVRTLPITRDAILAAG